MTDPVDPNAEPEIEEGAVPVEDKPAEGQIEETQTDDGDDDDSDDLDEGGEGGE